MDIKNEVLVRIYILLFGIIVPITLILMWKTINLGFVNAELWRELGEDNYIKYREIEAERGNIMSDDGSLLATSIPYFDIYFDPSKNTVSDRDFNKHVDSLAQSLSNHIKDHPPGKYAELIRNWREQDRKYVLIKRGVSYQEKKLIEKFPLFELGQFRGGFIAERRSKRVRPFKNLALRSVGYVRDDRKIGLEGYFNDILAGKSGQQFMIQVDQGIWKPLEDLTQIKPDNGDDILTTIDINMQDITETALLRAMNVHDAEWGVAIVMDVKTGAIKAITNLSKENEDWYEIYNHAIASATEPGSTFKLASMMALLEDGYIQNLDDTIQIYKGRAEFYEEVMEDSNPLSFKIDSTSIKNAFEISSNVGIAKLVETSYGNKNAKNDNLAATRFIDRLKQFNLKVPTGIEINGEATPKMKEAYSDEDMWSGVTLPWMSIGYELTITPLQLLTFYNAVANDGTMMKPYLVSEIQRFGETVERFKPTVLKQEIAHPSTIRVAKQLLEGVIENGTGQKLKADNYRFAGKTGTAQVDYFRGSRGTRVGGYQASFVGYFPAENPIYSCIVVINKPSKGSFYGGDVAGPVFREIADRAFASKIELHAAFNALEKPTWQENTLPDFGIGIQSDLRDIMNYLNLPFYGFAESELAVVTAQSDSLVIERKTVRPDEVPNVVGLGLRDALYILENSGMQVDVNGFGKVIKQSIQPGTKIKGQSIRLTLD